LLSTNISSETYLYAEIIFIWCMSENKRLDE